MAVLACDIEIYPNYLLIAFKRLSDGRILTMELSDRSELDLKRLRKIVLSNTIVTFNGMAFDVPLIFLALKGASVRKIKSAADRIIEGRVRYWEVEKLLDIRIPRDLDHIDLIEPQPNPFASLKVLNGRMHGHTLQDLPYAPDHVLTHEEMDKVAAYCANDLAATEALFYALKEPLEMRQVIGNDLGVDLRSKSDTQMGLAIIKNRAEKLLRRRIEKSVVLPGTAFNYKPPEYLSFETPVLKDMLERVREHEFVVQHDGKVSLPDFLAETPIVIGETTYAMGIGGLHSTESNRAVHSDDDFVLFDADCAAYYPNIILSLGLYPPSIGKDFLPIFDGIRQDRMVAKRAKDKVRDKGLKIANNGTFGSLGSRFSIVFAPHLLIATTLTGQLALLMLIERAEAAGIQVVSANTDGVVFRCPRDLQAGVALDEDGNRTVRLNPSFLADLTGQWESDTKFDLEFVEYQSIYNQSVNSYFAIKADGGHKRKGPLANPWSPHPDDNDARGQLMKNPQATICSDAALALIKHGTPIEETIYGCTDIRQFVTVIKADGGATWRGDYLGKVVRYYWATDGDPIFKAKAHAKTGNHPMVPKTEGCAPCMTLPDELPDDIDYARYIRVANEILMDIGYMDRPPPLPKLVRLTKANTVPILHLHALAA